MNIDSSTKEKINALRILDVADKLGIHYSPNGSWRKALCFCHDDHSPSLGIKPASNKWKCFVCGHGGNHINLVMEHEHLNYHDACKWLLREFGITASIHNNRQSLINAIRQKLMNTINNKYLDNALLERFKGTSNEFTRALIQNNILTKEQTLHAIETFRLCTANDSVIFWQIDNENNLTRAINRCEPLSTAMAQTGYRTTEKGFPPPGSTDIRVLRGAVASPPRY